MSQAVPESGAAWFVYLVRCADGSLYTGVTTDLVGRLAAHNEGRGAKYTRSRLPVELVYVEPASDRSAAQRREHEIKQLPGGVKRALVANAGPEQTAAAQATGG